MFFRTFSVYNSTIMYCYFCKPTAFDGLEMQIKFLKIFFFPASCGRTSRLSIINDLEFKAIEILKYNAFVQITFQIH